LQTGWFTADNASNNDTALRELKDYIDPDGDRWEPVQRRVRCAVCLFFACSPAHSYQSCMEHALHLAAGHVLSRITPVDTQTHDATKDDKGDKSLAGVAGSDDPTAIVSNALCKLLGLIKQVCRLHCIYYIY